MFALFRRQQDAILNCLTVWSLISHVVRSLTYCLLIILTRALSHLQANRNEFDVVSLVVPTAWEPWLVFRDKGEDFDLHDYLKAVTAARNLPLQILRETRAFAYPCPL